MPEPVIVYCDGSSRGNPGIGGWAWWVHDECWAAGSLPHTTNQQAELIALLMAVKSIPGNIPLTIRTDSQYARNVVTSWMYEWRKKGWKTKSGAAVANLTIVKHLDDAFRNRPAEVTVQWVRGHAGIPGNEAADLACTRAAEAEQRRKPIPTGPGWKPGPPSRKTRTVSRPTSRIATTRGVPVSDRGRAVQQAAADKGVWARCPSCDTPINPSSLECRCSR